MGRSARASPMNVLQPLLLPKQVPAFLSTQESFTLPGGTNGLSVLLERKYEKIKFLTLQLNREVKSKLLEVNDNDAFVSGS